jgi:hypothetical protein
MLAYSFGTRLLQESIEEEEDEEEVLGNSSLLLRPLPVESLTSSPKNWSLFWEIDESNNKGFI